MRRRAGRRMRRPELALLLLVAVAGCGSGSKARSVSAPRPTTAPSSGQLVATLTAPNRDPKVGRPWVIVVTARDARGRPVRARVQYLFLFNGQVVAKRSNYAFTGSFRDDIGWPAEAVGLPLTFRALVTSAIGTKALDYPV